MATGDIIAFQIMDASALPNGGNIDGNGVIARIRLEGLAGNIGGSYDLSKLSGTGYRPGWNRAKTYSTTNVTSPVALTEKIIRQPSPNQTARIEQVVGSDLDIYAYLTEEWFSADTLASVSIAAGFYTGSVVSTLTGAGLTNSSTRAYRMPQISWVGLEPWRRMTSSGLTVEAIIDHHNARDGQPVPAVDFYVTRSGTTSTVSTNAMVLSDEITAPYRPGVFRATVPIGSLTQGEGDLGAIIYPWVGTATWDTNSANFETFPCVGTPKLFPVNIDTDGSYALAGAYISHTGSQIGTPTIGLLSALGAYVPGTTPAFANIKAVGDAARAWNNNAANRARVHDDMAGIRAVIPSGYQAPLWGASGMTSQTTYPPGLGYFGVTREAGSSLSNTGLTTNATAATTARAIPSRTILDGVGLFPGAAGAATHTLTDASGNGDVTTQPTKAAAVYLVVRDCTATGNNDNTNALFSRAGYRWYHRNSFTSCGDDIVSSNSAKFIGLAHLHGCTINNNANTVAAICQSPSVIGCDLSGVTLIGLTTGAAPDVLGRMLHNVRIEIDETSFAGTVIAVTQANNTARAIGVRGESWVNILSRKCRTGATAGSLGAGESPLMQISADFAPATTLDQPSVTNLNLAYISAAGARFNGPYNEAGTARVLKEVRQIGIAATQMNTKGDVFPGAGGASGNRTGTFAYRFGSARLGNVTGDNGANGDTAPGPGAWLGDALAPGSQNNVGYGNLWVADTSLAVGNTYSDRGNFSPKAALLDRIPTGRAATAYDLLGNLRRNDGAGAAGAIERLDTTITPNGATFGLTAGTVTVTAAARMVGNSATFGLVTSQAALSATPAITLASAAASFGLAAGTVTLAAAARLVPAAAVFVLETNTAEISVPPSMLVFTPSNVLALNMKAPESAIDWAFEFALDDGETISMAEWHVTPETAAGLAVRGGSEGISGDVAGCIITGGVFGRIYELTVQATTSFGRTLIRTAAFRIGPVL